MNSARRNPSAAIVRSTAAIQLIEPTGNRVMAYTKTTIAIKNASQPYLVDFTASPSHRRQTFVEEA